MSPEEVPDELLLEELVLLPPELLEPLVLSEQPAQMKPTAVNDAHAKPR
jgi:hypothetical protein